ncbi:MAG: hypothetical protein PW735_12140 [Acidobacteriaceae bacterium]|nr:hypothetical protein [Acidobacteriaceae bacterium]
MKTFGWVGLVAILQAFSAPPVAQNALSHSLRYERSITLPAQAETTACVRLDAAVFAHADSRGAQDLRLFADGQEQPYALTENSSAGQEPVPALLRGRAVQGDHVAFDLGMPSRPYSELDLQLDAKDFFAVAEVTGRRDAGSPWEKLGSFALFDLTSRKQARSTSLQLAETTMPELHVALQFATLQGAVLHLPAEVVQGASVLPSREAQVLYTPVSMSSQIERSGNDQTVRLSLPAHVPLERVAVELNTGRQENFARELSVSAWPAGSSKKTGEVESASGTISREKMALPPLLQQRAASISQQRLSVDAVMGANLRVPATVEVTVHNGTLSPLPLRSIQLLMRERRLCFAAEAGRRYVLRYGDPGLSAPSYEYAASFRATQPSELALLGAEQQNPAFQPRQDQRSFRERHQGVLWVMLLAVVAFAGATALATIKRIFSHPSV